MDYPDKTKHRKIHRIKKRQILSPDFSVRF